MDEYLREERVQATLIGRAAVSQNVTKEMLLTITSYCSDQNMTWPRHQIMMMASIADIRATSVKRAAKISPER